MGWSELSAGKPTAGIRTARVPAAWVPGAGIPAAWIPTTEVPSAGGQPASGQPAPRPAERQPARGLPAVVLSIVLVAAAIPVADAACPANALGTARILAVDAATTPRVGRKQFPVTLPLADHEVVLTFDDGPWPGTTAAVLDALRRECVRATFFLLGENAARHPELARREQAEGHTVAHHSFRHPLLDRMSVGAAEAEIDHGIAAVEAALANPGAPGGSRAAGQPATPFFRFPGFAAAPELLAALQKRHIVVFGADLWASDWNPMTPGQELQLLVDRLAAAHGGIVLLHDTKQQTAAMLPALLRTLKDGGYRIVHVVPSPQPVK